MRLVRYLKPGANRPLPGLIDERDRLRDLSYVYMDLTPALAEPDELDILASIEPATLPLVEAGAFVAPFPAVGRVFFGAASQRDIDLIGAISPDAPAADGYGLAAIVGAPGWSGMFALAAFWRDIGRLALGPWLLAPERRDPKLPGLKHALAAARDAVLGDVVLALEPSGFHQDIDRRVFGMDAFARR